ncbi:hypothetical protein B0G80_5046 [Paraburkholderia sp. BL6669N2]|uniref:hypothetical protein n=1 Tax=Paraburkholderia sp. BL6669N2 TaxID=1938807 RepID=UPI000E383F5B|nr:hypothetical protein [Paraburkholderia sp. BL6669N2]REG48758.1 hypothetical protein B0G80_5046 [Paraburkholderia sp. BL6669N2]
MATGNDGASREKLQHESPFKMPSLEAAVARRVRSDKTRRFVLDGKEEWVHEWIEIDAELNEDFPIAGVGPVLWVGKTPLIESERLAGGRYRFFAPPDTRIKEDGKLGLGRAGTAVPHIEQRSRIRLAWEKAE